MSITAAPPTVHTYSTSNTHPLTTHLALNACEALRGQCPCDEYRHDKRNDQFCYVCTCCMSDQFSQRPLHRATNVWSQRPWTNALGGLYLSCLNRMLGRRWIEGRDEAWRWYTSDDEKVAGDFPRLRERFSLQREVALYRDIFTSGSYRGDIPHSLTLAIYSPNFRKVVGLFSYNRLRVVFILK